MTDFPTLSHTSTREIPDPFTYRQPEKSTPFGGVSPYRSVQGEPTGKELHVHDNVAVSFMKFELRRTP